MTIQTKPRFYFIDAVTADNNKLNFKEPNNPPNNELTATVAVGSRTMTDLLTQVQSSMNLAGQETYTITLDRSTRLVTISCTDTFELLVSSGANSGVSVFGLLGFTGADLTGASSYTGDTAIGTSYVPQFLPQSFKSFDDNLEGTDTAINESADGSIVEVVTFGDKRFMEMELKFITNLSKSKGHPIDNNPSGLNEARAFLEFAIKKSAMEFMIDKDNVNSFDKVLLESTRRSRSGTGYELREMVGQGFNDHYETGKLKFRKV